MSQESFKQALNQVGALFGREPDSKEQLSYDEYIDEIAQALLRVEIGAQLSEIEGVLVAIQAATIAEELWSQQGPEDDKEREYYRTLAKVAHGISLVFEIKEGDEDGEGDRD